MPSVPPIQETPTRVPTGGSGVAPSMISPTIWWPRMSGSGSGEVTFEDVEVGAADSAGEDAEEDVAGSAGDGDVFERERGGVGAEEGGFHWGSSGVTYCRSVQDGYVVKT